MQDGNRNIRKVVILGGGSSGWMTAAMLAANIHRDCAITLVESEEIGIVGVGEATIPPIRQFNDALGIHEHEFVRLTKGSYKLGIQFVNWGRQGHTYFHPFGSYGRPFDLVQIQHHWQREHKAGRAAPFEEYCMAWAAAKAGRFDHPSRDGADVRSTHLYAYHFDANLYAQYLRAYSEQRRVQRVEGKVASIQQHPETGFVTALTLESGIVVEGDLFIDCSGFRALLIEGALQTGWEDWSHWLPADRAFAVPCERKDFTPYTRSTAHAAGWQWRIPLQHRTGNGHVYCSSFMGDDEATAILLENLDGKALAEPRQVRFRTGKRRKLWNKNVIAIGLSSGFLEPLESTSIHLIQAGISKLLAYFPDRDFDPYLIDEYNRVGDIEYERIRDFIILHYHLTERDDSELWRYCRHMTIPDSLHYKMEHFRRSGRIIPGEMDLFGSPSWLAVLIGQGMIPERTDPFLDFRQVDGGDYLDRLRRTMQRMAQEMPTHQQYIDRFCKAA